MSGGSYLRYKASGCVGSVEPVAQKPKCFWDWPGGIALTQLGRATVTTFPLREIWPFQDCVIGTLAGSRKRKVRVSFAVEVGFATAMPAQ